LAADLEHAGVAAGGVDDLAAFAEGESERLLAVNVLAGAAGEDGGGGMPVIGRGDDDRVNVFAIE